MNISFRLSFFEILSAASIFTWLIADVFANIHFFDWCFRHFRCRCAISIAADEGHITRWRCEIFFFRLFRFHFGWLSMPGFRHFFRWLGLGHCLGCLIRFSISHFLGHWLRLLATGCCFLLMLASPFTPSDFRLRHWCHYWLAGVAVAIGFRLGLAGWWSCAILMIDFLMIDFFHARLFRFRFLPISDYAKHW